MRTTIEEKSLAEIERIATEVRNPKLKGGGFDIVLTGHPRRVMVMYGFTAALTIDLSFTESRATFKVISTLPGDRQRAVDAGLPKHVGFNSSIGGALFQFPLGNSDQWATLWGYIRCELQHFADTIIAPAAA